MDRSKLVEVKDQLSFEQMLKKRIDSAANINVYWRTFSEYPGSKKIWYVEFEEQEDFLKGQIIKNAKSKIFVNGAKKVVVYVSTYANENIIKELDYIHNNYFFAMGTKRNIITEDGFFVMIFVDEECLGEGKNYGNTEKGILAYDGGFEDKKCVDLVISKFATADDVADTLERYMQTNGGIFKEFLWERKISMDIKEIVFVVEHNPSGKHNCTRRTIGTSISGEVIELSYGDEARIYIGEEKAYYVMRTYGETILDCKREVLQMKLPNNLIVKIYQKNAPEESKGDGNYWLKRMLKQI